VSVRVLWMALRAAEWFSGAGQASWETRRTRIFWGLAATKCRNRYQDSYQLAIKLTVFVQLLWRQGLGTNASA
jgi:hypothetical protein